MDSQESIRSNCDANLDHADNISRSDEVQVMRCPRFPRLQVRGSIALIFQNTSRCSMQLC
jgi:hypothetical protein